MKSVGRARVARSGLTLEARPNQVHPVVKYVGSPSDKNRRKNGSSFLRILTPLCLPIHCHVMSKLELNYFRWNPELGIPQSEREQKLVRPLQVDSILLIRSPSVGGAEKRVAAPTKPPCIGQRPQGDHFHP